MNGIKFIIPTLFLLGCGKATIFRLDKVNIQLIHEFKIDSVPCELFVASDTLLRNKKIGINLTFNVSYFGSSGGWEPGIGGTKDSILSLNVFLETKREHKNISMDLYNVEQNQEYNIDYFADDYRCTCYDSLKRRYFNYVHDKRYKKPTIYTYDNKNEIVYWSNGDTSVYKESSPIDMSSYETFFINITDFVTAYNKLYYKKVKTSPYESFKILNAGHDLVNNYFCFWISSELVSQMNNGDFISVIIELSNGRKLMDKVKIK